NSELKRLSYVSVERMNQGLKASGSKMQIRLNEPQGKIPGDIRNSMIVLVEDPFASGPLGYGPQTEDPITGEIISARTIMYKSALDQFAKVSYDMLYRENSDLAPRPNIAGVSSEDVKKYVEKLDKDNLAGAVIGDARTQDRIRNRTKTSFVMPESLKVTPKQSLLLNPQQQVAVNKKAIQSSIRDYSKNKDRNFEYLIRMNRISEGKMDFDEVTSKPSDNLERRFAYLKNVKNCAFTPSLGASLTVANFKKLQGIFDGAGRKPWENLTRAEKQLVINFFAAEFWVPTVIHELGHNMGLRHNFAGSEDKSNFPTADDLKSINDDRSPLASSVMDYVDDNVALKAMGAYDIAALKFAYSKKVDFVKYEKDSQGEIAKDEDGRNKIIPDSLQTFEVKSTLADLIKEVAALDKDLTLKEYSFCTDESVGINAGCRRFDLGTTYSEIAESLVRTYKNRYYVRNFRRDQVDFSLFDDPSYAGQRMANFVDMRIMMEVVERIKNLGVSMDDEMWTTVPFFKDIRQAANITGNLLIDVLTTPEMTCIVGNRKNDNYIVQSLPTIAGGRASSCWELDGELNADFYVVGQTGRLFNSAKSINSENVYADQVDVRGFWMDKRQALRALMTRSVGISTLDKKGDNYLDLPEIRVQLLQVLADMTLNQMKRDVEVELADGTKTVMKNFAFDSYDAFRIDKPISSGTAARLGIADSEQRLTDSSLGYISSVITANIDKRATELQTARAFRVRRVDLAMNTPAVDPSFKVLDILNDRILATPENILAGVLIDQAREQSAQFARSIALISADTTGLLQQIAKVKMDTKKEGSEISVEELTGLVANVTKEEITAEQKEIIEGNTEVLTAILEGKNQSQFLNDSFAVKILKSMSEE
ncbi:MAG: zinc-dependent metalloprotease, partial [Pseudobdellovibrionaceae bacterium]